jgi:hypothetical protein
MKKKIFTILILLTFNCIQSQTIVDLSEFNQGDNNGKYFKDVNNNFQNFLGTWEGLISNTKTFRINLFKITKKHWETDEHNYYEDIIGGSFKIIENANTPNETILFNSIKYYPQSNTTTNNVMFFSSNNGINGGGIMEDNCGNGGTQTFTVQVVMKILNPGNLPLQMKWEARRKMMFENWYLSIPKDINLIKQP